MKNEDIVGLPCVYRLSIKAIIKDKNGRVLLIREGDGGWELPGGGLEHNESPMNCLKRELKEEIGVRVSSIADKPSYFWTISADVGARWFGFVVYEAKIIGNPRAGEEADESKFFNVDDIQQLDLHANTKPYFDKT